MNDTIVINCISKLQTLTSLCLDRCHGLTSACLPYINKLINLQSLFIFACMIYSDAYADMGFKNIKDLVNLTSLQLEYVGFNCNIINEDIGINLIN